MARMAPAGQRCLADLGRDSRPSCCALPELRLLFPLCMCTRAGLEKLKKRIVWKGSPATKYLCLVPTAQHGLCLSLSGVFHLFKTAERLSSAGGSILRSAARLVVCLPDLLLGSTMLDSGHGACFSYFHVLPHHHYVQMWADSADSSIPCSKS